MLPQPGTQVVVVAGPSGAGKSRLAARLRLPVLRLDDFYKEAGDLTLPHVGIAGGAPIVDWDHPDSWNLTDAVRAIEELCANGHTQTPVYDISTSRRTGMVDLDLEGAPLFLAEGIFAQCVVAECLERGLLTDAVCLTQHPMVTFWRRLTRDLREHRKPPWVLVRRGLHLLRAQRAMVADAERRGCRVVSADEAFGDLSRLATR